MNLYNPLSAKWIVDSLSRDLDEIGLLYMITNTLEMRPYVKATDEAKDMYAAYLYINNTSSTSSDYYRMSSEYYPQRAFSTALMLRDWMSETGTNIVKKYGSTPGALYSKLSNADWLIYASAEVARILKKSQHKLVQMRVRLIRNKRGAS